MAATGLRIDVSGPSGSFDLFFDRPPIFVGRRPSSDCVLDGPGVSKTHACLDVRGGAIRVRDCGSANGTFVAGNGVRPHEWVRVGPLDRPVEIRISGWTLVVTAFAVAEAPANRGTATLTDVMAGRVQQTRIAARAPAAHEARVAPVALAPQERTVSMGHGRPESAPTGLPASLDAPYADAVRGLHALRDAVARLLLEAPGAQRRSLCERVVERYPLALADAAFASLLKSYGWSPPESPPLASSALEKMQELARWYLGPERAIANELELGAFKEHQRRALDELFVGFTRLVAGLGHFEQRMSLRQDAEPGARTAAELIHELLDWRRSPDDALQHVRASFADLMMHQVALLQGVMRGVSALLTELSPATIERLARERRPKSFLGLGGVDPWAAYMERHADLSGEESERFRILFGAEFADEYRQLARDLRPADPAPPSPAGVAPQRSVPGAPVETPPANRGRRD